MVEENSYEVGDGDYVRCGDDDDVGDNDGDVVDYGDKVGRL